MIYYTLLIVILMPPYELTPFGLARRLNHTANKTIEKPKNKIIAISRVTMFEFIFYCFLLLRLPKYLTNLGSKDYINIILYLVLSLVIITLTLVKCHYTMYISFYDTYLENNYNKVPFKNITNFNTKKSLLFWRVDIMYKDLIETFYVSAKNLDTIYSIINEHL